MFDEVNQEYALSSLHRHIPCACIEKQQEKPVKKKEDIFCFPKQTLKSTVCPLNFPALVSLEVLFLRGKKKKERDLSGIMFYITINRCIITIRINTALIDYLANIGIVLG